MSGLLVVISGFSGVGKGTLVKGLLEKYPEDFALSISATSRAPREGEIDGREYFFKTKEQFEEMIQNDAFLEYARYNGQCYGTPKEYVFEQIRAGKNIILEIDVQGGLQIKKKFPETLLLFVIPPEASTLIGRLENRGTETSENIRKRLQRALSETEYIPLYDNVLCNDDFEESLSRLEEIIRGNIRKPFTDHRYIEKFKKELNKFLEE